MFGSRNSCVLSFLGIEFIDSVGGKIITRIFSDKASRSSTVISWIATWLLWAAIDDELISKFCKKNYDTNETRIEILNFRNLQHIYCPCDDHLSEVILPELNNCFPKVSKPKMRCTLTLGLLAIRKGKMGIAWEWILFYRLRHNMPLGAWTSMQSAGRTHFNHHNHTY